MERTLELTRLDGAVLEERLRIARDLHDGVGHLVSLMVISAGALEAGSTGAARAAGAAIGELGREAMAEVRAMAGLIGPREVGEARRPGPSLGEIAVLLDLPRRAGIEAELRVEGERRRYAGSLELSAYRIVEEALVNVARHAAARRATVRMRFAAAELTIEVVDDGRGAVGELALGHGLIAMRERAALFGGEFEFGPADPVGFRVAARLPAGPAGAAR